MKKEALEDMSSEKECPWQIGHIKKFINKLQYRIQQAKYGSSFPHYRDYEDIWSADWQESLKIVREINVKYTALYEKYVNVEKFPHLRPEGKYPSKTVRKRLENAVHRYNCHLIEEPDAEKLDIIWDKFGEQFSNFADVYNKAKKINQKDE